MPLSKEEIENRFGTHRATIEGPNASMPKHAELRDNYKSFAKYLDKILPDSREKSLALTHLEDASMWSHKGIAVFDPIAQDDEPHIERGNN